MDFINVARKNNYLGFFKFYQPKATGGGFLIFEWTFSFFSLHTLFSFSISYLATWSLR
jgi:hypothetical protein